MSLEMAQKVIVPQKKNYVPQFLKQRDINSYYAPEAHIMYLTVSSSFLVSFVKGGSGPSSVIKFLYAPERPDQGD
jgi:hypothetical protein